MTRSRFVAGDPALAEEIGSVIAGTIAAHAADPLLGFDVADMRARLEAQKPSRGLLDLKHLAGGTTDLEFLAQWSLLVGRVGLEQAGTPTGNVLRHLAATFAGPEERFAEPLREAVAAFEPCVQLLRLGPTAAGVADLPPGLAERLARALDLADPAAIEPEIARLARGVREVFTHFLPFRGAGEVRET